jgi:hypothetical protein
MPIQLFKPDSLTIQKHNSSDVDSVETSISLQGQNQCWRFVKISCEMQFKRLWGWLRRTICLCQAANEKKQREDPWMNFLDREEVAEI